MQLENRRDGARLVAKELQLALSSEARTLYFHGESMRPFLGEGDEVVVTPARWEDIRVGDIITYRSTDKFPTRRVIKRYADQLHLWCENWPDRHFYATRGDVLGKAVARKRDGEWITHRDSEWRAARRAALAIYRRRVTLPQAVGLARSTAGRILRRLGLRRSKVTSDTSLC
jgi:hypothetical protein